MINNGVVILNIQMTAYEFGNICHVTCLHLINLLEDCPYFLTSVSEWDKPPNL